MSDVVAVKDLEYTWVVCMQDQRWTFVERVRYLFSVAFEIVVETERAVNCDIGYESACILVVAHCY